MASRFDKKRVMIRPAMREGDIRSALKAHLRRRFAAEPDTLFIDEMGLCQGAARIDVAVVNGSLHGFEIKSEADTLARLPIQSRVYSDTFDYVTIVVSRTHRAEALNAVPLWWGLAVASDKSGEVVLRLVRSAKRNPAVKSSAVVQLLWRDEAAALLHELGELGGYRAKPKRALWDRLAELLPAETLGQRVRSILKLRPDWRPQT